MKTLQELLDEKWPYEAAETPEALKELQLLRLVFEQGWHSALIYGSAKKG